MDKSEPPPSQYNPPKPECLDEPLQDYKRFFLKDQCYVDVNHVQAFVHYPYRKNIMIIEWPPSEENWACRNLESCTENGDICFPRKQKCLTFPSVFDLAKNLASQSA